MSCEAYQGVQVLHGEVAVFVDQQQSQGYGDGNATEPFSPSGIRGGAHPFHQEEIEYGGDHKLDDKLGSAPSIKNQRGQQKHIVARLLRHQEIHQEEGWHEVEKKYVAAKDHICQFRV